MTPRTEQGRWLLDHQGLINATGELTGNSIDLRQSILTIEAEAVTLDAARDSAGLREAAQALVDAAEAVRDAINGVGHPGTPHDRDIHMDPCTSDPGIHVYSPSSDCAACGGAEYGTEDTYSQALGDLRAALGMERRPWEGPGLRAALVSPAEPGLDVERLARALYLVQWDGYDALIDLADDPEEWFYPPLILARLISDQWEAALSEPKP